MPRPAAKPPGFYRQLESAPPPIAVEPKPPRPNPHSRKNEWVEKWLRGYGPHYGPQGVLLDVGCGRSTVVTLGAFHLRYTIDPMERPPLPDVLQILGLFPDDWHPLTNFRLSVITCLDVLHSHWDPSRLAQQLLQRADRVIVSIPWGGRLAPAGDPVDQLATWFGRRPRRWEQERTDPVYLVAEFSLGERSVAKTRGQCYTTDV